MSRPQFVYLHVGNDASFPTLLVRSIRASNKDAVIYQCSDTKSPAAAGIDHIFRLPGDASKLIAFRAQAYAELNLTDPAIYMDTDMLVVSRLDVSGLVKDHDVALCLREFGRNTVINTAFRGMNLSEYTGKTFGEVYPYLGCAAVTRNNQFWIDCLNNFNSLPDKFHFWYGDQEALRNVANSNRYRVAGLPESKFACLPDETVPNIKDVSIFHFKGVTRKHFMIEYAKRLDLIAPHELR